MGLLLLTILVSDYTDLDKFIMNKSISLSVKCVKVFEIAFSFVASLDLKFLKSLLSSLEGMFEKGSLFCFPS